MDTDFLPLTITGQDGTANRDAQRDAHRGHLVARLNGRRPTQTRLEVRIELSQDLKLLGVGRWGVLRELRIITVI